MSKELRKKYVCMFPFSYSEISENHQWLCCPSWLREDIKESEDYGKNWYSDKSNKIRESILDGSYKYCDAKQCPYLSELDNGRVSNKFIPRDQFETSRLATPEPRTITFGWDPSCNLQCPSCRLNFVNYKGELRDKVDVTIDNVSDTIGKYIENITLCGAGDPFFSKSYVNFMKNFDSSKFPKLKKIHIHTNANLWTPKLWKQIKKVHKYISSCEISIDAATKDTYENKVRLRGDWDLLQSNLQFISKIPSINVMRFSFVVQQKNYTEMRMFYEMITNLMRGKNKKYEIYFNAITDWGAYPTKELFEQEEIHNPNHPEYEEFVKELKKVTRAGVIHNFHHIDTLDASLI